MKDVGDKFKRCSKDVCSFKNLDHQIVEKALEGSFVAIVVCMLLLYYSNPYYYCYLNFIKNPNLSCNWSIYTKCIAIYTTYIFSNSPSVLEEHGFLKPFWVKNVVLLWPKRPWVATTTLWAFRKNSPFIDQLNKEYIYIAYCTK